MRRTGAIGLAVAATFAWALIARAEVAEVAWPPDPALFAPAGTPVVPGLAVGDVLDRSNAAAAVDLLPPEILHHYAEGEYRNEIASMPDGIFHHSATFERATAANVGRYDVDPESGTIVERATGVPASDIYGLPFPGIAPDDPAGGLKAVWNYFHVYWNSGSFHIESAIAWVGSRGFERQAIVDTYFQFYENQDPGYRVPNPGGYVLQSLAQVKSPADLQGTVALSYRYQDPKRQDSLWTYVPALRRVRMVSPSNRSDGLLGTDLSLDDGSFFDAKPANFTWRTIGLRDGLRLADPTRIRGGGLPPRWTGEGWRPVGTPTPTAAGFQVKGWSGVGWAPVDAVLVKRRFWVVEAVPRDPNYLFGRIELWIDAENWQGAWSRKFSWKGEIAATYQLVFVPPYPVTRADGQREWTSANATPWQCIEAVPFGRATLAGLRLGEDPPEDFRTHLPVERIFDFQVLTRLGR